jgi:hypothetical protein
MTVLINFKKFKEQLLKDRLLFEKIHNEEITKILNDKKDNLSDEEFKSFVYSQPVFKHSIKIVFSDSTDFNRNYGFNKLEGNQRIWYSNFYIPFTKKEFFNDITSKINDFTCLLLKTYTDLHKIYLDSTKITLFLKIELLIIYVENILLSKVTYIIIFLLLISFIPK